MRGSEFAGRYAALSPADREAKAVELALAGGFVRWPFVPVKVLHGEHSGEVYVASDYFAIGEPGDFLRMPLSALAAQRIADANGWLLPTPRIVDASWRQAHVRLPPQPWGPPYDESMASMVRIDEHNRRIQTQLEKNHPGEWGGRLVAGHKKDVVLSNHLRPGKVAIYGWHRPDGRPIQPLNAEAHDDRYADYSHGARFVEPTMVVDGAPTLLLDIFADPELAHLVSDEGVLRVTRQPVAAITIPGPPPTPQKEMNTMLRLGSKSPSVADWQEFLNGAGFRDMAGTSLEEDGDFGARTEQATRAFQAAAGIAPDGVVGPITLLKAREVLAGKLKVDPPSVVIEDDAPITPTLQTPSIPFKQARNFTKADRKKIDLVVIHDMEYPETPRGAEWCADFFAGENAPKASAHYAVDSDSVVQMVREEDVAWHAPGANHNGVGVEHAGYARQTRAEWLDEYSTAELKRSAKLVADVCRRWDIPAEKLSAEDLRAGKRGICGHKDVTDAWPVDAVTGKKRTHWDPGPNFPWQEYIAWVREALG